MELAVSTHFLNDASCIIDLRTTDIFRSCICRKDLPPIAMLSKQDFSHGEIILDLE